MDRYELCFVCGKVFACVLGGVKMLCKYCTDQKCLSVGSAEIDHKVCKDCQRWISKEAKNEEDYSSPKATMP